MTAIAKGVTQNQAAPTRTLGGLPNINFASPKNRRKP